MLENGSGQSDRNYVFSYSSSWGLYHLMVNIAAFFERVLSFVFPSIATIIGPYTLFVNHRERLDSESSQRVEHLFTLQAFGVNVFSLQVLKVWRHATRQDFLESLWSIHFFGFEYSLKSGRIIMNIAFASLMLWVSTGLAFPALTANLVAFLTASAAYFPYQRLLLFTALSVVTEGFVHFCTNTLYLLGIGSKSSVQYSKRDSKLLVYLAPNLLIPALATIIVASGGTSLVFFAAFAMLAVIKGYFTTVPVLRFNSCGLELNMLGKDCYKSAYSLISFGSSVDSCSTLESNPSLKFATAPVGAVIRMPEGSSRSVIG